MKVRVVATRCGGFTYVFVLLLVALLGLTLSAAATVWSTASQRDKEADLLFVGREYREALQAYNRANPMVGDGFPKKLEDLLVDSNTPAVRRFLRKLYVDPMTGNAQWGLIRTPAGSIQGVYSLSSLKPIRGELPSDVSVASGGAVSYSDWKFAAQANAMTAAGAATNTGGAPASNSPAVDAPRAPIEVAGPGPAPPVNTPEEWKERRCRMIAQMDQGACLAVEQRYGQRAGLPCAQSAEARQAACQSGSSMPRLVVNER